MPIKRRIRGAYLTRHDPWASSVSIASTQRLLLEHQIQVANLTINVGDSLSLPWQLPKDARPACGTGYGKPQPLLRFARFGGAGARARERSSLS